ncbi:MAG: RNA 2',3'-cyclic phosphodiesterase [Candidatus Marinimicrobia bacterium]|nr:RNA 2',3'-cyclic phosphodiesterase [Candidatus Neomarinimicrobiota bacterium]
MKNKRTFIAIPLPPHIRDILQGVQKILDPVSQGIKWVDPELMHITLKFLGSTPERLLEDVRKEFLEITAPVSPFRLQLSSLGHFPRKADPAFSGRDCRRSRTDIPFIGRTEYCLYIVWFR